MVVFIFMCECLWLTVCTIVNVMIAYDGDCDCDYGVYACDC